MNDNRGEQHLQERESYLEARVECLQQEVTRLKASRRDALTLLDRLEFHSINELAEIPLIREKLTEGA